MKQDMKKSFEGAGFKVQTKQLADFQDGYGFEAEEGDDVDEEMTDVSGFESGSESEEE